MPRAVSLLSLLVAALLVVSAALFAGGLLIESRSVHPARSEPAAEATSHSEASETAEHDDGETDREEPAGHVATRDESGDEQIFGLPIESPLTVTSAIVLSLLLALVVWRRPGRVVLLVTALFAAGAAAMDVAEVIHQAEEGRGVLVALAGLVALSHGAVVAVAAVLWRKAGPLGRPSWL